MEIKSLSSLLLAVAWPTAVGADSLLVFDELPVLIGEGTPSEGAEHYWFPEDGAVLDSRGTGSVVVANIRFVSDGGKGTPPPELYETRISADQGRTWRHLWYNNPIPGTATFVASSWESRLVGYAQFLLVGPANISFTSNRIEYWPCQNVTTQQVTVCSNQTAGVVTFSGFPFPVARFTYASKVIALHNKKQRLVQLRAYSHKLNEVGGADENLAAFGSEDGGGS